MKSLEEMQEEYNKRLIVCDRCKQKTDNTHQGHYWKFCSKSRAMEEFHFCCPSLPCEYKEG